MPKTCPLPPTSNGLAECSGERCAWYDADKKQCAVSVIAQELTRLHLERNSTIDGGKS